MFPLEIHQSLPTGFSIDPIANVENINKIYGENEKKKKSKMIFDGYYMNEIGFVNVKVITVSLKLDSFTEIIFASTPLSFLSS